MLKTPWKKIVRINEEEWAETGKIAPEVTSLLEHLVPLALEHINQKEASLKSEQLGRLKRKLNEDFRKNNRSVISEIFWLTHLISKGWQVVIEPDCPEQGPDCLGRINDKDVYFEVVSPTEVWEREKMMIKCGTLRDDLSMLNLPKIFLIAVWHVDPEFDDGEKRSKIKEKVKEICRNPPNYEKFYLVWRKDDSEPFITAKKFDSNGYVIEFDIAKKFGIKENNICFGDLVRTVGAHRPENEFIKWVTGALENKLKKQLKPKRVNYLVVDVPISLTPAPRGDFEELTKNVVRYRERLDFVYGLFIIERKFEQDIWTYNIELKPNSKTKSLISDSILNLCREIKIKLENYRGVK
jgi:hypothetical protein